MDFKALARKYNDISLIKRIVAGLAVGAVLGIAFPNAEAVGLLGTLFVSALKAVAPVLVFFLVIKRAGQREGGGVHADGRGALPGEHVRRRRSWPWGRATCSPPS